MEEKKEAVQRKSTSTSKKKKASIKRNKTVQESPITIINADSEDAIIKAIKAKKNNNKYKIIGSRGAQYHLKRILRRNY